MANKKLIGIMSKNNHIYIVGDKWNFSDEEWLVTDMITPDQTQVIFRLVSDTGQVVFTNVIADEVTGFFWEEEEDDD